MASLVDELIQKARNSAIPISDLLRDAFIVATRLKLPEFAAWIQRELKGYQNGDEKLLPDYRRVQATLKAMSPIHGPIPLPLPNPELTRKLTSIPLGNPLSELEACVQNKDRTTFMLSFDPEIELGLIKIMNAPTLVQPVREYSKIALNGILDAVRTRVLEWALELEAQGIHGEGMSFSAEEKQRAQSMPIEIKGSHNIFNIQGNNSLAQINSPDATQTQQLPKQAMEALEGLIETLQDLLAQKEVPQHEELETALLVFQEQREAPQANRSLVRLTAQGLKSIAKNTVGSILASKLLPPLNAFLSCF